MSLMNIKIIVIITTIVVIAGIAAPNLNVIFADKNSNYGQRVQSSAKDIHPNGKEWRSIAAQNTPEITVGTYDNYDQWVSHDASKNN